VKNLNIYLILIGTLITQNIFGYGLPNVNLGLTNMLDGGPIRPNPGWYWYEFAYLYHTDKFLDSVGEPLGGVKSPNFNSFTIFSELIYQTKKNVLLNAKGGFDFGVSTVVCSHVDRNNLGIISSGAGFGNTLLGTYLQWDPVMRKDRPLFVHRLEFQFSCPSGKCELPRETINPGTRFFYFDPYWAATFYFTERASASWRLYYLWCAKNTVTDIKQGSAVHLNFSLEYEIIRNLYLGFNGYYLQQIENNKLENIVIPDSKERVLGLGPGVLYFFSTEFVVFSYLYFETNVRNRSQGMSFIFRFVKHF